MRLLQYADFLISNVKQENQVFAYILNQYINVTLKIPL